MDNSEITAVEWCFGAGGNHLGLRRVLPGLRLVAACEIEGYAVANVVAKMEAGLVDPAPVWTDCRTFPCELFADRVALFIASYPCQPFSVAGKKKGHADDRNLWPFVLAGVRAMRPMRCFFENVENHVSLGLSTVLSDLEEAGYRSAWGIFSAEECGAPHRRKRVFVMADALRVHGSGGNGALWRRRGICEGDKELAESPQRGCGVLRESSECERQPNGNGEELADASERFVPEPERGSEKRNGSGSAGEVVEHAKSESERESNEPTYAEPFERNTRPESGSRRGILADTNRTGFGEHCGTVAVRPEQRTAERSLPHFPPGPDQLHEWREVLGIDPSVEPALCRMAYGLAYRVDRLRLTGNGVVPDTAALAWGVLNEQLNSKL